MMNGMPISLIAVNMFKIVNLYLFIQSSKVSRRSK